MLTRKKQGVSVSQLVEKLLAWWNKEILKKEYDKHFKEVVSKIEFQECSVQNKHKILSLIYTQLLSEYFCLKNPVKDI